MSEDLGALLQLTAKGDRNAFRNLYDAAAPRLLGIAIRMLGRRDLAEDVLQETFVNVWRVADRFDPTRGRAEAWLATILRRRTIDRLRASPWLKREVPEEDYAPGRAQPEGALAIAVRQCLERLAAPQRRALMLIYYYGFTHVELSERLEAPLGTVKSQVRRGLIAMRDCLSDQRETGGAP